MVDAMIRTQSDYANRASGVTKKLDRYRQLRAKAMGTKLSTDEPEAKGPCMLLAPYFAVRDTSTDPWWNVMTRIWNVCSSHDLGSKISPVIAVGSVDVLEAALASYPDNVSSTAFFWVTGMDERKASSYELERLWKTIEGSRSKYQLLNLYGGYFSICLKFAGLTGFSNGLAYSESRAWPELSATGAAPARYYIPKLHSFMSLASAQELVNSDEFFSCPCEVCLESREKLGTIPTLSYHQLKKHFALCRKAEIDFVLRSSAEEVAYDLRGSDKRAQAVLSMLPPGTKIPRQHLSVWADTIARSTATF